jgi:serine/threonine protein kinase
MVGECEAIEHIYNLDAGGVTLTVFKNGAVKYVHFFDKSTELPDVRADKHADFDTLKKLYSPRSPSSECVLNQLPNCVKVEAATFFEENGSKGMLLSLSPRGERVHDPKTRVLADCAVALAALCDVLRALLALHTAGWVHRDVRWPNILTRPTGGCMLIDFEYAAPHGKNNKGKKVTWHNDKCQPKEARKSMGVKQVDWEPKHDLWQVGALLKPFVAGSSELRTLQKTLENFDTATNFDTTKIAGHAIDVLETHHRINNKPPASSS